MTLQELWNAFTPWLQLLSVVGAVVQCLGVWVLWSLTRKFVTREDCTGSRTACQKAMAEGMKEQAERLKVQEASSGELHQAVAQAAPKDKLAEVDKADEALRGDIKALVATVNGLKEQQGALAHQVSLLMRHHLAGGTR